MSKELSYRIYHEVLSIGDAVLELSDQEIEHKLEDELGAGLPDDDLEAANAIDFRWAGLGISQLVSDYYRKRSDKAGFYEEKAEEFAGFIENMKYARDTYKKEHLVQYSELYRRVAEEEGLETGDYPGATLVTQPVDEIEEEVLDMLSDMSDQLEGQALA